MRARTGIERRVEAAVRRALSGPCRAMRTPDSPPIPVVVAVSGGADSLALLYAFLRVTGRARGAPTIVVAHFDHAMRDMQAGEYEAGLVASHAAALGCAFEQGRATWRASRPSEDAARRRRYAFLHHVALKHRASLIATGHTVTDQAETVLLHLTRGAGLRGLAGMDWRSPFPLGGGGPDVIRPLLGVTREETASYCAARGIMLFDDPSNIDRRFARNRIRLDVLPVLQMINSRAVQAIARVANTARDAGSLIDELANHAEQSLAVRQDTALSVPRSELERLPAAVRWAMLHRLLGQTLGEDVEITSDMVGKLEELVHARGRSVVQLPGNREARTRDDAIELGPKTPTVTPAVNEEFLVAATGDYTWGDWQFSVVFDRAPASITRENPLTAWLRGDLLERDLTVGPWRPGDRIAQRGMVGTRKLQDVFTDAHLPREQRNQVPIVRAGGRVAWVCGLRLAAWAVAAPGEQSVRMAFSRRNP